MCLILFKEYIVDLLQGSNVQSSPTIHVYFSLPDHNVLNKSGRCLSFFKKNPNHTVLQCEAGSLR